jgi:hypothetical protein
MPEVRFQNDTIDVTMRGFAALQTRWQCGPLMVST